MSRAETPVAFDPLEPGYVQYPYDQYDRLRAADPVHWSDLIDGWVLTRYADISQLLRDPTLSVEIENATRTSLIDQVLEESESRGRRTSTTLVLADDPTHARLRRLIASPFTPRAVAGLVEMTERRVATMLDALIAERGPEGEIDVIGDFAYPFPVTIFCEMLGVPEEDSPKFRYWTNCVARDLDPLLDDAERAECRAGSDAMYDYLEAQADEKRRNPGDDIMTALVMATEEGDKLSPDELLGQLITLYVAGHEPVTSLIGTSMLALARYPEQLATLRADPDLLSNAVLEFLRWDGPNQFIRRIATHDHDVGGQTIKAGDVMLFGLAAANRDPDFWGDDVAEVRVDRADLAKHLQFGSGVHKCLGLHLAKMWGEVALRGLLDRFDHFELAGEPTYSERMVIRGLATLPIRYST